jgi:NitT/TauT family transport system substrate-binding protein
MIQRLWKLTAVICILSLLASCSALATPPVPSSPLRVEFSSWWGDYTLIIAQQRNLFEKHGVDVELVYYDLYYNSLADLASGQLDGGLYNIGDALNVARHIDVSVLAVYDDGGPNTVIATPQIQRISDLKGKRVGVPLGSSYELFIDQMLDTGGLSPSDVTLFNYDPAQIPAALGDSLDAGFTWEPYTSEALSEGNVVLFTSSPEELLFPDMIAFRREVVENRPDDVRAFLRAWFEAVEFRQQNPQAARQIIADYFGVPVSDIEASSPVKLLSLGENIALYTASEPNAVSPIQKIARINVDFLVRIGTLTEYPDFIEMFDAAFLR